MLIFKRVELLFGVLYSNFGELDVFILPFGLNASKYY